MVLKALFLAIKAHKGQKDKNGVRYILHPVRVALKQRDKISKVVALLHDVVEDTPVTLSQIEEKFGTEVSEAVDCLTKREGEPLSNYLYRVMHNNTATKVKLADLLDNANLLRCKTIGPEERSRTQRYCNEIKYLSQWVQP